MCTDADHLTWVCPVCLLQQTLSVSMLFGESWCHERMGVIEECCWCRKLWCASKVKLFGAFLGKGGGCFQDKIGCAIFTNNGFSMRTLLSQGFGQSVAMTGSSAKPSTQNRVACH